MERVSFEGNPERDPGRKVEREPQFDRVGLVARFENRGTSKENVVFVEIHKGQSVVFDSKGEYSVYEPRTFASAKEEQISEDLHPIDAYVEMVDVNGKMFARDESTELTITGDKGYKTDYLETDEYTYILAWGVDKTEAIKNLKAILNPQK